jgi:TonB family protein
MPTQNDQRHYLEINRHILRVITVSNNVITALSEVTLINPGAIAKAMGPLRTSGTADEIYVAGAAINPFQTFWHVSTPGEASRYRTAETLQTFTASLPHAFGGNLALAHCLASDGEPVPAQGDTKWLLGITPVEAMLPLLERVSAEGNIATDRVFTATVAHIGALKAALGAEARTKVALWEWAEGRSQIVLVSGKGVEAIESCPIGNEELLAAIQKELGLNSRVAAENLFANEAYDFSESRKLGERLASAVRPVLAKFQTGNTPPALFCPALLGPQQCVIKAVATALGTTVWSFDRAQILKQLELQVRDETLARQMSAGSYGLLYFAAMDRKSSQQWCASWLAQTESESARPEAEVPAPSVKSKPPMPTAKTTPPQETKPAVSRPAPAAKPAPKSEPRPTPAPARAATAVATATAIATPKAAVVVETKVTTSAKPATEVKPAVDVKPATEPKPALVAKAPTFPKPNPLPKQPVVVRPSANNNSKLYMVAGACVVLLLAVGGWFYMDSQSEKKAAAEREERALVEQKATEARLQEVQAKAAAEAEQQKQKAEADRQAAIAQAKKEAEEAVRTQLSQQFDAERRQKFPGMLIVTTQPSGASISIDGQLPQMSPVTLHNIEPGKHKVSIILPGYDSQELSAEVIGGQTADLGLIQLEKSFGTLSISTVPQGVSFVVKKTGAAASDQPVKTGTTPAHFDDLLPGDYVIEYKRAGWSDQTLPAQILRGETSTASYEYQGNTVVITSTPSGAKVIKDGVIIGSTPMTLHDLPPQKVEYTFAMPGYDSATMNGNVTEGGSLNLNAVLLSVNRLATAKEIKDSPKPLFTVAPLVPPKVAVGTQVTISLIVEKDGKTRDIAVEKSTDTAFAEECLKAVRKWKFSPAINKEGKPVNLKVSVPFAVTPNTKPSDLPANF